MLIQTAHRKHDLILFAFATTFTALILLTGAPWALPTEWGRAIIWAISAARSHFRDAKKPASTGNQRFVKSILAVDPRANVIALGDFKDFEFSTSLNKLKGGVLRNLIGTLPQNERYTYVFEGNSQTLDHILVTNKLSYSLVRFEVVHINSEFLEQASNHDPTVAIFRLPVRRSHLQGKRISPTVFWKLAPRPQRNVIRQ